MNMVQHRRAVQQAKFALRHWKYYEQNLQGLSYHEKNHAIALFKGLQQLEQEEVQLLAERYYKSTEYANMDNMGQYHTVKPVSFEKIAKTIGREVKALQSQLREIERKLGNFIIEYEEQSKKENEDKRIPSFEDCIEKILRSKKYRQLLEQKIANKRK
ncbi:hypothetical protein ACFJYA_11280 [Enterococcus faecalis]